MEKIKKRYFVEFWVQTKVTGYVNAQNMSDAKKQILSGAQNPSFDTMDDYSQASEMEFEWENCQEDF